MRVIRENDTIQIEITTACVNDCANCTRSCGHYKRPWFMDFDTFKRAVDSMVGFNGKQGVGIMGGEPMLHPLFSEFARYAAEKLSPEKLGLWSCFPVEKKHLAPVIAECFGTVFPDDHEPGTPGDALHSPILVSIEEVLPPDEMWYNIERCWAWASWSASINPLGAYFCEIAAALAALFGDSAHAWPVEPGWWKRTPKDYREQMEKWCPRCGLALCGPRQTQGRFSSEEVDDVSPGMLERLKAIDSPKVAKGRVAVHDLKPVPECRQMATYKDLMYRKRVAGRYGLLVMPNQVGFLAPFSKIVGGSK